jgi:hypothetical protein
MPCSRDCCRPVSRCGFGCRFGPLGSGPCCSARACPALEAFKRCRAAVGQATALRQTRDSGGLITPGRKYRYATAVTDSMSQSSGPLFRPAQAQCSWVPRRFPWSDPSLLHTLPSMCYYSRALACLPSIRLFQLGLSRDTNPQAEGRGGLARGMGRDWRVLDQRASSTAGATGIKYYSEG